MKSKILRMTVPAAAMVTTVVVGALMTAGSARAQQPPDTIELPRALGSGPMIGIMTASTDRGVTVTGLFRGGPAEGAGIRMGDMIVSLNGQSLAEPIEGESELLRPSGMSPTRSRLQWLLRDVPEGESVELGVQRGGELMTFTLVPEFSPPGEYWNVAFYDRRMLMSDSLTVFSDAISEALRETIDRIGTVRISPRELTVRRIAPQAELRLREFEVDSLSALRLEPLISVFDVNDRWNNRFERFGSNRVEVVQLNPELGSYFGTEEGVLVLSVDGESTLGLRPGDVVVRIGGRQVDDVSDMRRILASYEDAEKVDFGIWRDGAEATVVGTIR